jgi:hypothetical protein
MLEMVKLLPEPGELAAGLSVVLLQYFGGDDIAHPRRTRKVSYRR